MSQKATEELVEKENYHELTEKQKAIIDAYAENPDGTHTEIFESANENLSGTDDTVSRAYVPVVLDRYAEIAFEQKHKNQNGREKNELGFEFPSGVESVVMEFGREELEEMIYEPEKFRDAAIDMLLESKFK